MPFFIVGYYSEEIEIENIVRKYKKLSYILGIIIIVWFLFNQNFFTAKDTYLKYNYYVYSTPMVCFFKRVILYLFFMIFSIFVFNIFSKNKTILSKLGNKTLVIYLSHGILLKTIKHCHLFIENSFLGTILIYLFVLIIGILIYYILEYLKKVGDIFGKCIVRITKSKVQTV
jgi:fucose 4-O-acetylase-like acetyltransferase